MCAWTPEEHRERIKINRRREIWLLLRAFVAPLVVILLSVPLATVVVRIIDSYVESNDDTRISFIAALMLTTMITVIGHRLWRLRPSPDHFRLVESRSDTETPSN